MGLIPDLPLFTLDEISCGLLVYGPRFASAVEWAVRAAKEHGMKVLIIDRYGDTSGIASEFDEMVVLRPGQRRYNPLKPFGPPGPSVLMSLQAAAYSVGKDHPSALLVSRAQELAMAGKEPTGVSLAADLIEQELEELELMVRPSSVRYLGGKEDFDMEAMLSRDVLVDMSVIPSADEATLICLTCLTRIRNLATHVGSLVLIIHPEVFFSVRSRSPVGVQFPLDTMCSLASQGVNLGLACPSPLSLPAQMRPMAQAHVREVGEPPRVEVVSPKGRRSFPSRLGRPVRRLSDGEVEERISAFALRVADRNLPPWLVSDFGEEADAAADVIKHIARSQPSLDQAIGRANELARGLGGSVVGSLVRLRYATVEQVGSSSVVVLAEKGKRALSFIGGEGP